MDLNLCTRLHRKSGAINGWHFHCFESKYTTIENGDFMQTDISMYSDMDQNFDDEDLSNDDSTFGLFLNFRDATKAITKLEKCGISRDKISILAPQPSGTHDYVYQHRMNVIEGAVLGATIGFFALGVAGFFLGLSDFASFVPVNKTIGTLGPQGNSTWAVSTVIGCILGIIFGAASGALVGIGTPKNAAKRYGFYLKEGGIVVSVKLINEVDRYRVNQIFEKCRAQDVSELGDQEIWKTIVPEKNRLLFH